MNIGDNSNIQPPKGLNPQDKPQPYKRLPPFFCLFCPPCSSNYNPLEERDIVDLTAANNAAEEPILKQPEAPAHNPPPQLPLPITFRQRASTPTPPLDEEEFHTPRSSHSEENQESPSTPISDVSIYASACSSPEVSYHELEEDEGEEKKMPDASTPCIFEGPEVFSKGLKPLSGSFHDIEDFMLLQECCKEEGLQKLSLTTLTDTEFELTLDFPHFQEKIRVNAQNQEALFLGPKLFLSFLNKRLQQKMPKSLTDTITNKIIPENCHSVSFKRIDGGKYDLSFYLKEKIVDRPFEGAVSLPLYEASPEFTVSYDEVVSGTLQLSEGQVELTVTDGFHLNRVQGQPGWIMSKLIGRILSLSKGDASLEPFLNPICAWQQHSFLGPLTIEFDSIGLRCSAPDVVDVGIGGKISENGQAHAVPLSWNPRIDVAKIAKFFAKMQ